MVSLIILLVQVSASHTIDGLTYDGTIVEAFSLTGHDFPAMTSCSQPSTLMATTTPYQSSNTSPIVLEMAPTLQLGEAERRKRKRKKGFSQEQGMEASTSTAATGGLLSC